MLPHLFIAVLWSPAGKWLTSWLLFVKSNYDFVTVPYGTLGQVWYLIVLIPDLCRLSYFYDVLSDDKQAIIIDSFNTTSGYLDDNLNINNIYFDNMVSQIFSAELQVNKANTTDTEASFLDLHLTISIDTVSTKIYVKFNDLDFETVNFTFLDDDVPLSTSY